MEFLILTLNFDIFNTALFLGHLLIIFGGNISEIPEKNYKSFRANLKTKKVQEADYQLSQEIQDEDGIMLLRIIIKLMNILIFFSFLIRVLAKMSKYFSLEFLQHSKVKRSEKPRNFPSLLGKFLSPNLTSTSLIILSWISEW